MTAATIGKRQIRSGSDARTRAVFLAPVVIGLVALVVIPLIATFVLTFFRYDGLTSPRFTGLANLRTLAEDGIIRRAFLNSLLFMAVAVPIRLAVAATVGIVLAKDRTGSRIGRVVAVLPTAVPDLVIAVGFLWLFNPVSGPLAAVFHGSPLGSALGARVSLVIVASFLVGESIIIALIARRAIPLSFEEIAILEGARPATILRRVTLPLMAPVLLLVAARDLVVGFQAVFVPALVLTEGGPVWATTTLPVLAYRTGFGFQRFGLAAAMTLLQLCLTGVLIAVAALFANRVRRAAA